MQLKHQRVDLTCRSVFAIYLLAAIILLLTPDRASAQGLPMLPDPINSRELMDYADRLTLSRQQKLAILPMHDAYFKRFARLRKRDIQNLQDDLMELIATINPMNLAIPPREDIEALVRQYDLILEKIRTVDRQLFSDIRTILTDEQMLLVDLVSRARERSLYRQVTLEMGGEFNRGTGIDLSELVRDLDLTSTVKAGVDPILRTYESALLERIRKLHREIKQIVTLVLDTIDDLGLRDMSFMEMGEQFSDEEFQETIMELFNEASRPFQKATSDISRLNLSTYLKLAKMLDFDLRHELRDSYFRKAYRRSVQGMRSTEDRFGRITKFDDLTDEQRREIKQLQEIFHVRNDPIVLEIAELIEDSRRYRTVMQLDDDENGLENEKILKLMERREQITKNTMQTIDAILGPELVARLENTPTDQQLEREEWQEQFGDEVPQRVVVTVGAIPTDREVDRIRFQPIPPRRVGEYAARLELNDSQRSILDSLYADYRNSYDDLLTPPLPEAASPPNTPEADRLNGDEEFVTNRLALEKAKARIDTFYSIQNLDATFFDNFGLVMEGDQSETDIARFRLQRRRELCLTGFSQPTRFSGDFDEARIDLTYTLDEINLSESDYKTIEAALHDYERESVEMLERISKTTLELERMNALSDVLQYDRPEAAEALGAKIGKSYTSREKTRRTLTDINRAHVAKLQDKLTEDARWRLVKRYNEQAFPEIYEDERSAERLIVSALQLDDLTSPQREGILQLATAYRERYHGLSQQMVDIVRQRPDQVFNGTIPMDLILRELQNEKLKYERNEASERTRTRIELLLSEEQMMLAKRSVRDG